MSSKCFITFLNTTAQSERSGSNPRLLPRCLRSSHASLLRRKVARTSKSFTTEDTEEHRGKPVSFSSGEPVPSVVQVFFCPQPHQQVTFVTARGDIGGLE